MKIKIGSYYQEKNENELVRIESIMHDTLAFEKLAVVRFVDIFGNLTRFTKCRYISDLEHNYKQVPKIKAELIYG